MKAVLKFDLDDHDDRMAHMRCVKAGDMASVLFEITHNLRKRCDHALENSDGDAADGGALVFEKLFELLDAHDINIDELID